MRQASFSPGPVAGGKTFLMSLLHGAFGWGWGQPRPVDPHGSRVRRRRARRQVLHTPARPQAQIGLRSARRFRARRQRCLSWRKRWTARLAGWHQQFARLMQSHER